MDNVGFCINDKPISRRVVLGKSSEDDIVKLRVTLPATLGLGVDPETLTYALHFALPDGTSFPTETLTLLGTTEHYVEYTVDDGVMLIEGYGTMALYGYDNLNAIVWESQTIITQIITAVIASGEIPVKETGRISTSTHTVISGILAGDGAHVGVATAAQVGASPIPDAGGYFATDTIDGALQSIGVNKADITYVDTEISAVASGAPAGVYATAAALTAAIPAGDTNIYLVTADGKWYYWSGAAWTVGGTYQATAVADGSITPAKTTNKIPNTLNTGNLFVKSTAVVGKYINDATGAVATNASFDYVTLACLPLANYFVKYNYGANTQRGSWFDSSGTWIAAIDVTIHFFVAVAAGTKLAFVCPANAAFVKINFLAADIDNVIIFQDPAKVHDGITLEDRWDNIKTLKHTDAPFITNILSDLSVNTKLDYMYKSNTSQDRMVGSAAIWSTPPLPCAEGEILMVENFCNVSPPSAYSSRGVYLDSNFIWLSNLPAPDSYSPQYTVPANAKYAMINYEAGLIASISVKRLYTPSTTVQIAKTNIYPAIGESSNGWDGLKWTSFGDSITYRELWQPYVVTDLGLVHTNCGIGSTALAGAGATAFWQTVRLDAVKAADPNVLTILGGANDLALEILLGTVAEFDVALVSKDTDVFYGAYSYIIENLLTWKPTLKIILLTTTYAHLDGATLAPASGLRYTDFANATKAVALYYGLPCVDLHGEQGVNKLTQATYTSDGIHPNAAGAKRIAEMVIGEMRSINPIA